METGNKAGVTRGRLERHDMSNYEVLKLYGFSPAKALEICLDVERGDGYAKSFLILARASQGLAI